MFESNFPPDKESCSYRTLYNAFKRMAAALELTAEEKADIFHDTALRACECFAASVHCTARYMYLLPHRALGHRAMMELTRRRNGCAQTGSTTLSARSCERNHSTGAAVANGKPVVSPIMAFRIPPAANE